MSKTFWIGLIVVVLGLVLALAGPSFIHNRDTYGIGDTNVTLTDRSGIPSWVGWVVAGIGFVFMISGLRTRRDSDVTVVRDTVIHEDHHPRAS
jgi:protein-S-isoprenylcysteine O-methyltransferase Ste14